jgi:hypothetical protein
MEMISFIYNHPAWFIVCCTVIGFIPGLIIGVVVAAYIGYWIES